MHNIFRYRYIKYFRIYIQINIQFYVLLNPVSKNTLQDKSDSNCHLQYGWIISRFSAREENGVRMNMRLVATESGLVPYSIVQCTRMYVRGARHCHHRIRGQLAWWCGPPAVRCPAIFIASAGLHPI